MRHRVHRAAFKAAALPVRGLALWLAVAALGVVMPARAEDLPATHEPGASVQLHEALQLRADRGAAGEVNFLLRRGRVGLELEGVSWVSAELEVSFDGIFLSSPGKARPVPLPRLHESRATFRLAPGAAYLSVGLFRPQLGRESLTSGFVVDSLDKSVTQKALREFLTGNEAGVSPGLNLGGGVERHGRALRYDVGLALRDPDAGEGLADRRLFAVARTSVSFGECETTNYSLTRSLNDFGERPVLVLAAQGSRELSGRAWSIGADALWRVRPMVLTAEVHWLSESSAPRLLAHVRAGVDMKGPAQTVIEPWLMASRVAAGGVAEASRLEAGATLFLRRQALRVTAGAAWELSAPSQATFAAESSGRGLTVGVMLQYQR